MRGLVFSDLLSLVPAAPDWRLDWAAIRMLWPELRALDACPQDPVHHGEGDVGTHTRMVLEALVADPDWRALPDPDRDLLFWTAVLHDVGKPGTTVTEDGRIKAPGHSRRGSLMARSLLRDLEAPFDWREALCGLIAVHQVPFWLIERDDPAREAIRLSWCCRPDLLCLHARADARGRIAEDVDNIVMNADLAREMFAEQECLAQPFAFANDESRVAFFERDDRDPHFAAWEEPKCTVTLLSGLPGSGKDTWIGTHMPGVPVISLDALRDEMGVSPTGNQGTVIEAARERAREHLRVGRDFVWNATNITRQVRAKPLSLARAYGARVEIVYLEVPPTRLSRQNRDREAVVPQDVLDNLARKLEPPEAWEAHRIHYVLPETTQAAPG
ncbi:AAA family ATPase [Maliponia aquimaris]|uniref:Multifunctional tRNA nucleotidyl transferase/2'3'-cyclic phosphodiesterase/2'nucleotidase/phosphatase n=1 Tax=Maliponia aquimaris TaxID=1673631 RepID=A0A238JYS9_9RHOB|nr:AAA family ATPase [Maliponia aquimaris]SMX35821.1 multifunctional tRNA nucleotidyl transferase/2'3'-cyclic phosphodiesterase/2'nucleotidase/phosphatase [Maliponia aquimaris]